MKKYKIPLITRAIFLTLLNGALACSGSLSTIEISVDNQSGMEISYLRVTPSFKKTPLADPEKWQPQTVADRLDRFFIEVPLFSAMGKLNIVIGGLNREKCRIASAAISIDVGIENNYQAKAILTKLDDDKQGCRASISSLGAGHGTITINPGHQNQKSCDFTTPCAEQGVFGSLVTISAQPDERSYFVGWSGSCHGRLECQVTLEDDLAFIGAGFQPRRFCTSDNRLCWESPLPTGNAIRKLWAFSPNDVWAVGTGGTILRWNGDFWYSIPFGVVNLVGVWGSSPNDVWIVGSEGTLLRWDGDTLNSIVVDQFQGGGLLSVWGMNRNDVWITETDGRIWHWDGQQFELRASSPFWFHYEIWGSSSNDVWIVGDREILHWDGTKILPAPFPIKEGMDFFSVSGSGPKDVWFTGAIRSNGGHFRSYSSGHLFHYSGGSDFDMDSSLPDRVITSVWAKSSSDVWAGGSAGVIRHYDGTTWTNVSGEVDVKFDNTLSPAYSTVHGSGQDDVWFGGVGGSLTHWNGSQFVVNSSNSASILRDIWIENSTNAWAVGENGSILHWNGTDWLNVYSPLREPWRAIWGVDANDFWIGGGFGIVKHWNGSSLKAEPNFPGEFASITSIWGTGKDNVYFSTDTGWIVHWNGISFDRQQVVQDYIGRIWGSSSSDLWAVGGKAGAIILHFEGNTWVQKALGVEIDNYKLQTLTDIGGSSKDDVWFAGIEYALIHYDGKSFKKINVYQQTDSASDLDWTSIWARGKNDVWLVAEAAYGFKTLHHFDGTNWYNIGGLTNQFWKIRGLNENIWAIGPYGAIMHIKDSVR